MRRIRQALGVNNSGAGVVVSHVSRLKIDDAVGRWFEGHVFVVLLEHLCHGREADAPETVEAHPKSRCHGMAHRVVFVRLERCDAPHKTGELGVGHGAAVTCRVRCRCTSRAATGLVLFPVGMCSERCILIRCLPIAATGENRHNAARQHPPSPRGLLCRSARRGRHTEGAQEQRQQRTVPRVPLGPPFGEGCSVLGFVPPPHAKSRLGSVVHCYCHQGHSAARHLK